MNEDARRDLVSNLTDEIKLELDEETIRNLPDEALEELGDAYLRRIGAMEEDTGKSLGELLTDEEFLEEEDQADESPFEDLEAADAVEIPDDDDDDLIFEGKG